MGGSYASEAVCSLSVTVGGGRGAISMAIGLGGVAGSTHD